MCRRSWTEHTFERAATPSEIMSAIGQTEDNDRNPMPAVPEILTSPVVDQGEETVSADPAQAATSIPQETPPVDSGSLQSRQASLSLRRCPC